MSARILVGTSGYQYKDWVGSFYPTGTRTQDMLAFYAERFSALELNFTYYGCPKAEPMRRMAESTPDGFVFLVKANQDATHKGELSTLGRFAEGLGPLREAGKLGGVLCQFPYGFRNSKESREYLASLRKGFGEVPVFVEFRHASWAKEAVFEFLKSAGIHYVSVDEPELPGLMPRIGRVTGKLGYVRFHSRRKSSWWGGGKGRYDYLYKEDELSEWLPIISSMADEADRLYVFFNNCSRGSAARNAEDMRRLLGRYGLGA